MNADDLKALIESTFQRSADEAKRYAANDTERIAEFFGTSLPPLFVAMRSFLRTHAIPGDHLPADEIIHDYRFELEHNANFKPDYIPFFAIGNGDYLCLSRDAGAASPVLYVAHDDPNTIKLHSTFDDYLVDTDWFLLS
jgi:hypothetical protein